MDAEPKKKQKVLIVHNYYQIPGGEDTVVANEKKLLEDHGHEVVLYTRHNNELKKMSKLRKLLLPFTTIYNPRTARDIRRIIREEKIDIVHVHNTLTLVSPAVYYAALKAGVPVVQTVHNFRLLCPGATFYRDGHICEDCVENGLWCAVKHGCYRGNKAQTLLCVISAKLHRATGIYGKMNYICLTEFNREKLLLLHEGKQLIAPERVFVKPNFTFEAHGKSAGEHGDYYLFIGRIEEIKGVRLLIEAFRRMPEKKLRLAGDGVLMNEMRRAATDNVTFLGRLNRDRLDSEIEGAIAVILPSQVYEGFPMTIAEAFSHHKPMIVGDMGNTGVLVEDGVTGVKFTYDSVAALVEAIDRLEKMDIRSIGETAYAKFVKEYTSDANYRKLLSIYEEVR